MDMDSTMDVDSDGEKFTSHQHPKLSKSDFQRSPGPSLTHHTEYDDSVKSNWRPSLQTREDLQRHIVLPLVISGYLQLAFNLFVLCMFGYVVFAFVESVQNDVDGKVEEYSQEVMAEIALCSKSYIENRCSPPEHQLPAMKQMCHHWELCMNRDPRIIGRTKLSAEALAEIVNGFIEPISYKTMVFFSIFLFGFLLISNFAFHLTRTRTIPFLHQLPIFPSAAEYQHTSSYLGSPRPTQSHLVSSPMPHVATPPAHGVHHRRASSAECHNHYATY
eukprot:Rmarinus@m.4634